MFFFLGAIAAIKGVITLYYRHCGRCTCPFYCLQANIVIVAPLAVCVPWRGWLQCSFTHKFCMCILCWIKFQDIQLFVGNDLYISFTLACQVTSSVAKISIDATPDLAGDIKQLFIKLLLPPAKYVYHVCCFLVLNILFPIVCSYYVYVC
mgnify:CR=1 FL=1